MTFESFEMQKPSRESARPRARLFVHALNQMLKLLNLDEMGMIGDGTRWDLMKSDLLIPLTNLDIISYFAKC